MLKRRKLGTKLVLAFLTVGLTPFAVVGVISLMKAGGALSDQAFGQLESVREIKKTQIEQSFADRRADMDVLKETVEALRGAAFEKLETVQELKKAQVEDYFAKVRADVLALSKSDDVYRMYAELWKYHDMMQTGPSDPYDTTSDEYGRLSETHGAHLDNFVNIHGYYDLFVICASHGHVMYTVAREPDLGSNLADGPYKNEALANLWKKVVKTKALAIEDFSPYSPSKGQQAAFIGAPIHDQSGALVGVVALQLPTEPINRIVQKRDGMGKTGETYLVGKHGDKIALRSDMKTIGEGKFVIGHDIKTPYIEEALGGKEAQGVYTDSAGNLVMVAYDPLKIEGFTWACISKINLEEAIAPGSDGGKEDYYARYVERYGYYDLFLIHPKGNVFYSVTHESDYGTNMVDGKYAGSGLGQLVRRVLETKQYGVADFAPYAPSNNEPAAFVAEPIMQNGEVQLIVALQLSLDAINRVMQQRAGMGKTGETYLVGPDKLMRSDSYLDPVNHSVKASFANPGKGRVDTKASQEAAAGNTGEEILIDYNGNPVLSAFTPIKIGDATWALIAEIDEAEAFSAVHNLKIMMAILAGIGMVVIVALALFIARSITRPINRVVEGLSEGAEQVAGASGQVASTSQQLAEGASEQAASIEETSASLEEIASMTRQNAQSATQADNLMKQAHQVVEHSNSSMVELTTSMQEISRASEETSKIIKTIDEIAFQTNLLALNAAVEAARAGDAGAGFAVVADEVRNLAMRAADAAKNTANLIEATVEKVKDGSGVVERTNQAFSRVAVSTSKVGELLGEIAAASGEQAQGIDQINKAVAEMDKVVQQNAANAEESAAASEQMNAQAGQMQMFVGDLVTLVGGAQEVRVEGGVSSSSWFGMRALNMAASSKKETASLPGRDTDEPPIPPGRKRVPSGEVARLQLEELSDF